LKLKLPKRKAPIQIQIQESPLKGDNNPSKIKKNQTNSKRSQKITTTEAGWAKHSGV
jgi:hypothetical protein